MKRYGQKWADAIERSHDIAEWVPFVCEIPAGSPFKTALDKRSGILQVDRVLADSIVYPTNYGFVPRTIEASDGMEIDLLAIASSPLPQLSVMRARIVGGFTIHSSDSDTREDKLIGAVLHDPRVVGIRELSDVDRDLRARIEDFFRTYKQNESVTVAFQGWFDRAVAMDRLAAAFKARKKRRARP